MKSITKILKTLTSEGYKLKAQPSNPKWKQALEDAEKCILDNKAETSKLAEIEKLMQDRIKNATHNSNGIVWTLPYQSISISVSEINKILTSN